MRPGFTRRADVAARRTRVVRMRTQGVPYAVIAAELGVSEETAKKDWQRALGELRRDQAATADEARTLEAAKLDAAECEAWRVLRAAHVMISGGRIVLGDDGVPLPDDGPVLAAIDRLLRVSARRAALLGLNAPARIEATGADAEIRRLVAELGDAGPDGNDAA